jgi:LysR family cys regulon transcriptional activator
MTLKQLRILREIARQAHNLSSAATALHTSQPGVSRQVQLLERELGVELLTRRRNRITGLTEPGRAILTAAERALSEADNIRLIAAEYNREEGGRLTIATSHLHARYTLAHADQGVCIAPPRRASLHAAGRPGRHIAAGRGRRRRRRHQHGGRRRASRSRCFCPGAKWSAASSCRWGIRSQAGSSVTLEDIAAFPLVGYNPAQRGGQIISDTFRANRLEPKLVVSAIDSDIIKAYVAEGLGIAVIPTLALDEDADRGLRVVDVTRLFPTSVMTVSLRRDIFLRRYVPDFIQLVAPRWDREHILEAMAGEPERTEGPRRARKRTQT